MTRNCAICLEKIKLRSKDQTTKSWDTKCCKIFVHYTCQVQWSNNCIICKKQIKCVSTTCFNYIPPEYQPIEEEREEDARAWLQFRRNTEPYISLLRSITSIVTEDLMRD